MGFEKRESEIRKKVAYLTSCQKEEKVHDITQGQISDSFMSSVYELLRSESTFSYETGFTTLQSHYIRVLI